MIALVDAPLAFAFGAGLFATINPCGFAMLPAYLSYFLGLEERNDDGDARHAVGRALYVGSVVSVGFFAVFGVVGVLLSLGVTGIRDVIPWITIVIGVAMIALGVAMLLGFRLTMALPKIDRVADGRSLTALFTFGVSYAVTSISCAFPLFFLVVTGASDGVANGMASFAAYAAGMSLVLIALTVSLAVARRSLVLTLRRLMRHVDTVAGVFLVLAGTYTVWFWVNDLRGDQDALTRWVDQRAGALQNAISDAGTGRVGLVLALIVTLALIYLLARPSRPETHG